MRKLFNTWIVVMAILSIAAIGVGNYQQNLAIEVAAGGLR